MTEEREQQIMETLYPHVLQEERYSWGMMMSDELNPPYWSDRWKKAADLEYAVRTYVREFFE